MVKKIKLTTVEDYLDRNLKRNSTVLGFDVSVHSTGIAMIRTTDTSLIIDHTHKLITPKDAIAEKAEDIFISQLDAYKNKVSQKFSIDTVVIEDCFFGMNVKITKALARCSGLTRDRFKSISNECYYRYPKAARKLIGMNPGKLKAHQLKKFIVEFINDGLGLTLKVKDNDIADALVLVLGGLVTEV